MKEKERRISVNSSRIVQKDYHGEPFPVHETVNVINARTIEKGAKFWQAAILYDTEFTGRKTLAVYLWQKDDSKPSGWKRKQKMIIKPTKWEYVRDAIEELIPELAER